MGGPCEVPFTVREAAEFFRVERATVWGWIRRYHLEPVGMRGLAKLYRFGDLVKVERAVRTSAPGRHRNLNPEMFGSP